MGTFIALGVIAFAVWVAHLVARAALRRRVDVRDDMRRVGDQGEQSPRDAALRAQGKAAWMRMSGF